jgi:hypothetical protein
VNSETQHGDLISLHLFFKNKESRLKMDLVGQCGLNPSGRGHRPMLGFCECSSEPPSFIKDRRFSDWLNDYHLFKDCSAGS